MANIKLINKGTINKNAVILRKDDKTLTIYFSYETPIGFSFSGNNQHQKETSKNEWGTTTGKFLNELEPNHKGRIPHDKMMTELEKWLNEF